MVLESLRSPLVCIWRRIPRGLRQQAPHRCIADQLRHLRTWLIIVAGLPIAALVLRIALRWSDRGDLWDAPTLSLLSGWLLGIAAGVALSAGTVPIYRATHRRRLRCSLKYHQRGVALRSFIAKWDCPSSSIYRSCRLSKRLGNVYNRQLLTMVSCFAVAGCFAALIHHRTFIGELLTLVSLIAIGTQWPTSHRLVRWSGHVIDPLCGQSEEYIEC
ncbi:hypothetical protein CA85_29620 [Allorhodopirellula solitaria]|uniref:Uncharacterized protein n=2 Tax=Allorhodopirellula solitaria TaxID=2527987 RepID=A0A5C5XTS1_9BACT|nr:hypothetical protein CA85_29620 [Allorhodopirellula solitaria]